MRNTWMLVTLSIAGALLFEPGASAQEKTASVFLVDDGMSPLRGAALSLDDGTQTTVAVTDRHGQSPWFSFEHNTTAVLTVADHQGNGGQALGFIAEVLLPSFWDTNADVWTLEIARTVPLAVDTLIAGDDSGKMVNIYPTSPDGRYPHAHWIAALPASSELQFSAGIAPLLDGEAVAGYMAYRGHAVAPTDYVRGTALTVPAVDLGEDGFYFAIDLLGAPTNVTVDAFNFTAGASTGEAQFAATVEQVYADRVLVHLTGLIEEGHLALLVRHVEGLTGSGATSDDGAGSAEAGVFSFPDNPPEIVIPSGGTVSNPHDSSTAGLLESPGEDAAPAASRARPVVFAEAVDPCSCCTPFVTDCEPPVPGQDGWTCYPLEPESECPVEALEGQVECHMKTTRTPRWCRDPGDTLKKQTGTTLAFKTKFTMTGGSNPLSTEGGFEYGHSSTTVQADEWTAKAGVHGLGQCKRYYRFYLDCAQDWETWEALVEPHPQGMGAVLDPCGLIKGETTLCHDLNDSSAKCDRKP